MLAVLKLEYIGENHDAHARSLGHGYKSVKPWIARLTGYDEVKHEFIREFMRPYTDYSQANSVGSRGVYLYFPLKDGIYEVKERLTWNKERRYFIHVENAAITEIASNEVYQHFHVSIEF